MRRSKSLKSPRGAIIAKLRKPMAPPTQTIEDEKKYRRERERERLSREKKSGNT